MMSIRINWGLSHIVKSTGGVCTSSNSGDLHHCAFFMPSHGTSLRWCNTFCCMMTLSDERGCIVFGSMNLAPRRARRRMRVGSSLFIVEDELLFCDRDRRVPTAAVAASRVRTERTLPFMVIDLFGQLLSWEHCQPWTRAALLLHHWLLVAACSSWQATR